MFKRFFALLSLTFVLSGTAFGQSNLPSCHGTDTTKWSNCIGKSTAINGDEFIGEFRNGKSNGWGVLTDSKGNEFVGEYKDDKAEGVGLYTFVSGDAYAGEFSDGQINGWGTYTFANKLKYVGEFQNGRRHGQGTMFVQDGSFALGEWANGLPNGRFIEYRSDKSVKRSGIYIEDKLVTPQYIDPNSFTRIAKECISRKYANCGVDFSQSVTSENVKANQLYEDLYGNKIESCHGPDRTRWSNCIGEWTAPNGNKYTGEFKDGKFNGLGTFIYFTGSKYVGEFKNDRMEGQGTHTFASGVKHVGEFKDDKFNGRGITYSANGSVEKSGIFKDFTLVTSQYIDPNSFTRIAGNSKLLAVTDAKKTSSSKWETVIPGNSTAPAVTESQRLETDRLKNELDAERQRLAEEKRRLDAQKIKIEEEKKSSRIAIKSSASQPDANGDFIITISTGADTASLKIDGDELGGKRDGNYVIKRVARVGEQNNYAITATDVFGTTD